PAFHKFPISRLKTRYDFSFSGIKTSVLYYLKDINFDQMPDGNEKQVLIKNICASFQKTMVDTLINKVLDASVEYNIKTLCIAGGVSANSGIKKRLLSLKDKGYEVFIPSLQYSTDNAAMIGLTGYLMYEHSKDKDYFLNESFAKEGKPRLDRENF